MPAWRTWNLAGITYPPTATLGFSDISVKQVGTKSKKNNRDKFHFLRVSENTKCIDQVNWKKKEEEENEPIYMK